MERLMTALLELTLPMALVIAVLLAAGPLLGRRFTAKWRYWAWLLIAVRLLLPVGITLPQPVVTLPQPQGEFTYPVSREEPAPTEPAPVGDPIQVVPGAAENDPYQQIEAGTTAPTGPSAETPKPAEPAITPTPAGTRSIPVMEAVGWCWAAGTALFLLWQLGSYLALRAKLSRSRRPLTDEAILAVLERESAAAGLRKPLPVYTAAVGSPMIVGAIKPTLLLPELELSTEQLSLVFRHELIHYRRRDIWYKLLLMLANAIHWFNPMVWLMVYAADRDLELSCDEAVVAGRDEAYREEYGRCLLAVVRAGMSRRTLFTTNFYSGKKTLKNRLATIFDTTKKHRGTLALAALLLAAAVAGSLVACTPDGGKNRYNIDLNDMDALSREYLAPLAAMGDIYWSGYQELKSGPLLKYAIYELYGYTGEEKLDLAAAYGTADAEKRAALAKLMDTNYDASGKLPNAQNFYLPQEEVAAAIQKHFDMSPEMADASLKDLHNYDGYFWVSPWNLGDNLFAYAREATIEGDTLTIRYSLYEAQPGDEGFLAQHMADYTQTHESCGRYAITIRLEEDGGWKYVSNRTVPTELENGVVAMSIGGMLSGSGWQPLYTCPVPEGDGYNEVFSTTMSPRLLADGTMAIPVIRGDYEDGKTIAVVLLRLDGSYTAVETPLTCGGWMRNVFDNTIGRDTETEATRESIIIRTEYSQNVGTVFGYYQPTRVVETEVWSDGRLESRDYVPEGSRYTMLKSPDGQHFADATGNGSLTIDGVTVIETGLDREIWEYDRYYRPELWLDNDRLVISSNYYRYSNDYGIYSLSTGEVTWMNLGKMNGNGLSGIRLLDGKLFWTVMNENFFTDDESGSVSEMAFYSLPVEELPYGTPTRMATKLYYGMEHNGRLWTAETNYTATGHLTVLAFDPESGESAELDIPVAEWLDGVEQSRSWTCNAIKMTAQGMVLRGTQYMENDNYGTDWIILVPHALLDNMEWQRLPSVLDSAEEMPLTEIEEVFGGRWQDMEYGDGYTLTIYREGDALYCRWADMEPQQLVKAYKTGKTGYYITTRRADGTTDALALDTGKPKDNKITAMLYEWRNLTYQGEA